MSEGSPAAAIMSVVLLIVGFAVADLLFAFTQGLGSQTHSVFENIENVEFSFDIIKPFLIVVGASIGIALLVGLLTSSHKKKFVSEDIDPEIPYSAEDDKISTNKAIQLAKRRFVRGEITKEEYTMIRSRL